MLPSNGISATFWRSKPLASGMEASDEQTVEMWPGDSKWSRSAKQAIHYATAPLTLK